MLPMFYFLSKITLLHGRHNMNIIKASHLTQTLKLLRILQENPSLRLFSTTSNQQSFVVSYLINKFGLSPESALLASKRLKFETPDKPDSVITFLKNHGFSETQIKTLVKRRPILLTSDVEKTLSPKVEFFYSRGISRSDVAAFVSQFPYIFSVSLENQIIPYFNILRNFLVSDENAFKSLKLCRRSISHDINSTIPNINVLRYNGVPEYIIVKLLTWMPKAVCQSPVLFKENVEKLKEMGFNPQSYNYCVALYVLASLSKSTLEKKFDAFNKYGWSEEEVLVAFRRTPFLMATSKDKIMAAMDFLVNTMGLEASLIAKRPYILTLSMEKRLVPRGLFAQDLLSKGLLKKGFKLSKLFWSSEKVFLDRFVYCYAEKAPKLLKLYEEKINLSVGGKGKIQKSK